jgi:predicted dehydrogenase
MALCSRDRAKADAWGRQYGLQSQAYDDYETMLRDPRVDVVFQNGMLGNFICSWAATHTNLYMEFNVYGTDGFLHLTYGIDGVRRLEQYQGKALTTLYEFDSRQPGLDTGPENFVGECEHCIACIERDKEPLTNGRVARKSMAAILAAYQGDDTNRIIWLESDVPYAAQPGSKSAPATVGAR